MEYDRERSDPPGCVSCNYLGTVIGWSDCDPSDEQKERRRLAWAEWDRVARHGFLDAVERLRAFGRGPSPALTEDEASILELACQVIEDMAPPKGAA